MQSGILLTSIRSRQHSANSGTGSYEERKSALLLNLFSLLCSLSIRLNSNKSISQVTKNRNSNIFQHFQGLGLLLWGLKYRPSTG